MIISFSHLNVWKEGHKLVLLIYKITKSFPKEETYSLTDQLRRSAVSITSNIAEGYGRNTMKDKMHFYYLAQGSLTELKNQIIIAHDIEYIDRSNFQKLIYQSNITHQLLQGLLSKSRSFLKTNL